MMNKEEVISKYNKFRDLVFEGLDGLKEVMESEEFQKIQEEKDSYSDEEYEKVELMYGDFYVFMEEIASAY